jgi:hypothetical protein
MKSGQAEKPARIIPQGVSRDRLCYSLVMGRIIGAIMKLTSAINTAFSFKAAFYSENAKYPF